MQKSRRPDAITVAAILAFVMAIPFFLGAIAIVLFAFPALIVYAPHPAMGLIAPIFGMAIGILFTLAFGALLVIAGIGLLRMQNWARIMILVLAILMLPGFPIGTLLGIVALWYFTQAEVKALFDHRALPPRTPIPGQED
jgi:hypothetical protein